MTQQQKHTPGPWKFERSDWTIRMPFSSQNKPTSSQLMGDYLGCVVADLNPSHGSSKGGSRDFAHPEAEANARLIAAAPEMLEALKSVREYLNARGIDSSKVDAVIAKAEGRSA